MPDALSCPTGNRVTLRDWLDLTVKEGLTVYREDSFMADLDAAAAAVTAPHGSPDWEAQLLSKLYDITAASAGVTLGDQPQPSSWRRVLEGAYLREEQFDEDEGPLAHPIRPKHVTSLCSLYTDTVYAKVGRGSASWCCLTDTRGARLRVLRLYASMWC
jgi:aminopeptidase N